MHNFFLLENELANIIYLFITYNIRQLPLTLQANDINDSS